MMSAAGRTTMADDVQMYIKPEAIHQSKPRVTQLDRRSSSDSFESLLSLNVLASELLEDKDVVSLEQVDPSRISPSRSVTSRRQPKKPEPGWTRPLHDELPASTPSFATLYDRSTNSPSKLKHTRHDSALSTAFSQATTTGTGEQSNVSHVSLTSTHETSEFEDAELEEASSPRRAGPNLNTHKSEVLDASGVEDQADLGAGAGRTAAQHDQAHESAPGYAGLSTKEEGGAAAGQAYAPRAWQPRLGLTDHNEHAPFSNLTQLRSEALLRPRPSVDESVASETREDFRSARSFQEPDTGSTSDEAEEGMRMHETEARTPLALPTSADPPFFPAAPGASESHAPQDTVSAGTTPPTAVTMPPNMKISEWLRQQYDQGVRASSPPTSPIRPTRNLNRIVGHTTIGGPSRAPNGTVSAPQTPAKARLDESFGSTLDRPPAAESSSPPVPSNVPDSPGRQHRAQLLGQLIELDFGDFAPQLFPRGPVDEQNAPLWHPDEYVGPINVNARSDSALAGGFCTPLRRNRSTGSTFLLSVSGRKRGNSRGSVQMLDTAVAQTAADASGKSGQGTGSSVPAWRPGHHRGTSDPGLLSEFGTLRRADTGPPVGGQQRDLLASARESGRGDRAGTAGGAASPVIEQWSRLWDWSRGSINDLLLPINPPPSTFPRQMRRTSMQGANGDAAGISPEATSSSKPSASAASTPARPWASHKRSISSAASSLFSRPSLALGRSHRSRSGTANSDLEGSSPRPSPLGTPASKLFAAESDATSQQPPAVDAAPWHHGHSHARSASEPMRKPSITSHRVPPPQLPATPLSDPAENLGQQADHNGLSRLEGAAARPMYVTVSQQSANTARDNGSCASPPASPISRANDLALAQAQVQAQRHAHADGRMQERQSPQQLHAYEQPSRAASWSSSLASLRSRGTKKRSQEEGRRIAELANAQVVRDAEYRAMLVSKFKASGAGNGTAAETREPASPTTQAA